MELNSEVLSSNSELFAGLITQYRKGAVGSGSSGSKMCRIEVPDVENLSVFREAIELMFEDDDITKRLFRIGVYRVIDVLEVSAHFPFLFSPLLVLHLNSILSMYNFWVFPIHCYLSLEIMMFALVSLFPAFS